MTCITCELNSLSAFLVRGNMRAKAAPGDIFSPRVHRLSSARERAVVGRSKQSRSLLSFTREDTPVPSGRLRLGIAKCPSCPPARRRSVIDFPNPYSFPVALLFAVLKILLVFAFPRWAFPAFRAVGNIRKCPIRFHWTLCEGTQRRNATFPCAQSQEEITLPVRIKRAKSVFGVL